MSYIRTNFVLYKLTWCKTSGNLAEIENMRNAYIIFMEKPLKMPSSKTEHQIVEYHPDSWQFYHIIKSFVVLDHLPTSFFATHNVGSWNRIVQQPEPNIAVYWLVLIRIQGVTGWQSAGDKLSCGFCGFPAGAVQSLPSTSILFHDSYNHFTVRPKTHFHYCPSVDGRVNMTNEILLTFIHMPVQSLRMRTVVIDSRMLSDCHANLLTNHHLTVWSDWNCQLTGCAW